MFHSSLAEPRCQNVGWCDCSCHAGFFCAQFGLDGLSVLLSKAKGDQQTINTHAGQKECDGQSDVWDFGRDYAFWKVRGVPQTPVWTCYQNQLGQAKRAAAMQKLFQCLVRSCPPSKWLGHGSVWWSAQSCFADLCCWSRKWFLNMCSGWFGVSSAQVQIGSEWGCAAILWLILYGVPFKPSPFWGYIYCFILLVFPGLLQDLGRKQRWGWEACGLMGWEHTWKIMKAQLELHRITWYYIGVRNLVNEALVGPTQMGHVVPMLCEETSELRSDNEPLHHCQDCMMSSGLHSPLIPYI